jgi:hypothetical protein
MKCPAHEPAGFVAQEREHATEHGVTKPTTFRMATRSGAWVVAWGRRLMQTS